MEDVLSNAPAQYGALGLLIIIEAYAIIKLWQQLGIERKARDDERRQYHKELLDLNDRLISSQAELQQLLKTLADRINIERLLQEHYKKD